MSRSSKLLAPRSRDGTSQRSRRLPALDTSYVAIDERTAADLLAYVQKYADQLKYFEADETGSELGSPSTWLDFVKPSKVKVSIADMVGYLTDPARVEGERARWLGRPHFALLLAFVELLGRAREHLNGFTRRHLDYYYRDVLRMVSEPAVPDHAAVIFGLAPGAAELRLPAGTELLAGRDPGGAERVYRTERDVVVNRAKVAALRSIFVDRRVTGISDVREDRNLTASQAFDGTLMIALGSPRPGDPVPKWDGRAIDTTFFIGLAPLLDFAWSQLFLHHHELRTLMRLYRQRRDAGAEWAEINRLMGVTSPADPRAFLANLWTRTTPPGPLDFAKDGLPLVTSVDDLYTYRYETDVKAYIDDRLRLVGFENFEALMRIKLRIDADWAEINRLIERIGRRQRKVLRWSLPEGYDPTAFSANLASALAEKMPTVWPPATTGIEDYEARLRNLEVHLSMAVERIEVLSAFAREIDEDPASEKYVWTDVDRILADAHVEKVRAARIAKLVEVRRGLTDTAGFDAVANFVLGLETPIPWTDARTRLAELLGADRLNLLSRFRESFSAPLPMIGFGWADADRAFELAWRNREGLPEPIAQKTEARNVYAFDDATLVKDDAAGAAPGWKTFGKRPLDVDERTPRGAMLGWALRSPLLSLSEGKRTLTLTLGLRKDGFDPTTFLAAFGLAAGDTSGPKLVAALMGAPAGTGTPAVPGALTFEVSTAKGWIDVGITAARLASGRPGDDYWSLLGVPRAIDEDRPGLQLTIEIGVDKDPIAPPKGDDQPWPALRISLKPHWDKVAGEWRTFMEAFEPVVLTAVHLKVKAQGITGLRLQQDDRLLDPKKPVEPFGSRPAVGASLYVAHPELLRARLASLEFFIEWMGLPSSLKNWYTNYPGISSATVFQTQLVLVDRNRDLALSATPLALFDEDSDGTSKKQRTLAIGDVPAAIQASTPGYEYVGRSDLASEDDVRQMSRYLRWDLTPVDFGHPIYSSLAAAKARALAVALATATSSTTVQPDQYKVEEPYTPKVKRISATYTTSIELNPTVDTGEHRIQHVHPFGACRIDAERPSLVPSYPTSGELYIGVRDLNPPRHLTLLVQLAEGTSDPDLEPAPISWSCLAGDRFVDLADGGIVHDPTRGLINSGIVELALPPATSGGRLPSDLYWLRVAVSGNPDSTCDTVAVLAQAASVRFEDRGNSPAHYEQPLPAGTIKRLADPDARITLVEQPYTSFGGKPPEKTESFDARVSERLRHKQRALSPWDYERLVLQRFPQIYKAKCLSSPGSVDVVVIPDIRELHPSDTFAPKAPANLLADIQTYLTERASAAARVRVRNAQYVSVRVRLGVRFRQGDDAGYCQRRLNDELVRFLSPWAFDDGAEIMIGGKIYANSILDFIDRREYVDFVAEIKLFRSSNGIDYELVPPVMGDYHVATDRPDQVLVAAQQHYFDVIPESGFQEASFTGINYARIELDFIVG